MWKDKKVSVVFSTYNEKNSIRKAVDDLFATKVVDEVIVVNNNAAAGTDQEVKKTAAKLFYEKKQGYGWGYRKGLSEATGDLIIMSEPDGTFLAKDVLKLLQYSEDFDVVFGTRTNNATIQKDANMGMFLKYGNWFVAKIMEFSFVTTPLNDVGCTMRLLNRKAYNRIKNKFKTGDSYFGLEMMLIIITTKNPVLKYVEIPVHYLKRVGKSSVTGSMVKAFNLGIKMTCLVIKYRFVKWFEK